MCVCVFVVFSSGLPAVPGGEKHVGPMLGPSSRRAAVPFYVESAAACGNMLEQSCPRHSANMSTEHETFGVKQRTPCENCDNRRNLMGE